MTALNKDTNASLMDSQQKKEQDHFRMKNALRNKYSRCDKERR